MAPGERFSSWSSVFRGWLPYLPSDDCRDRQLTALFAVVVCLVLRWPATAQQIPSSEMGWTKHYELVMSRNDRVCRPLLVVYNRLRAQLFAERKPFGLGDQGVPVPMTDFERTRPEAFRAAHLFVPPYRNDEDTSNPPYRGDPIYSGDFLHQGRLVELRVRDEEDVMGHSYTAMTLVPGGEKVGIETLIAEQATAHPKAVWRTDGRYTLTGWPGFDKIARLAASGAQLYDSDLSGLFKDGPKFQIPIEFPLFGPEVMQRPFLIDGKDAVFLMNDPAPAPPMASWSVVVLTRLMPNSHEDLCFLALTPSGLTRRMSLESRGTLDTSIRNSVK